MKILSIETSCDETAVSILEVRNEKFKVLGNALYSQSKIHEKYGGVFPMMAKKEHAANLIPLLIHALKEAKLYKESKRKISKAKNGKIKKILEKEWGMLENFEKHLFDVEIPKIDRIAVTHGPGLAPALWVGISFAKALSTLWNKKVVPTNHMRGHFLAPLAEGATIPFPAIGFLVSGGHTELIYAKNPKSYKLLGTTRDDAAGEAYDKVARLLSLPYPGGPHIAKLAEECRNSHPSWLSPVLPSKGESQFSSRGRNESRSIAHKIKLPRPMIYTKDLDFSFAGLKTSVLYLTRDIIKAKGKIDAKTKMQIAGEFEEAVKDVLVHKARKALSLHKSKALVFGGGVSANTYLKASLESLAKEMGVKFLTTGRELATDNSIMIAVAGFYAKPCPIAKIKAVGDLPIEK